ncbi:hypothetical protein ABL78_0105 [Leptomonas seymouri]|uniref:CLASP N-terminal domain-containing protein n=1 Tax=Leptomonas seymouri TaxID=5684 RepID=A0A0N1ICN1_LEPSE|nr:hypothetical protein ABL78_0105 [Leptomonas seymouri]|eukprot:KPI90872.1 hypothetical protein ABL78_0105 [Leptomonas seymouri]
MLRSPTVALTDQEVLKRIQHLGNALAASTAQKDPPHLNPYRAAHQSQDGWEHQVKLLEDVVRFISGDVATRPHFVGWMSLHLKNALISLLESRRSAVALAAMAVLDSLVRQSSSASRVAIATICSWFVSRLLHIATGASSAAAVSTAALAVLTSVVTGGMLTLEGLNVILFACTAVSPAVRRCAMGALCTFLQAAQGTSQQLVISAHTDALHRVLRSGVTDADAKARANARRCFWALHLSEPAVAETLMRALPPKVSRQLAEERERALESLQAVVEVPAKPPDTTHEKRRHVDALLGGPAAEASRTMTLKDELQAATAYRARLYRSRSRSPSKRHPRLLLMANDFPYKPDRTPACIHPMNASQWGTNTRPRQMSLLSSMESSDWSVRRAALLEACELCKDGTMADDMPSLLSALLVRLQEMQFRVVEAAQDCLRCCLQFRPALTQASMRESLHAYLNALFRNTAHRKPAVCNGACIVLDMLMRLHESPIKLLEAVLRSADDAREYAAELRVAEFLLYFVMVHPSLFPQQSITGLTVRSIVTHISRPQAYPSEGAHRAAAAAAAAAWSRVLCAVSLVCPVEFRDAFERLSPSQKVHGRAALRECFCVFRGGENGANSGDADDSVISIEIPCVFAKQLKEAYTAEQTRLSPRGGSVQLFKAKITGADAVSFNFVPPVAFPPVLKELFMDPPHNADSTGGRPAQPVLHADGAGKAFAFSGVTESSRQSGERTNTPRESFLRPSDVLFEIAGDLNTAETGATAFLRKDSALLNVGGGDTFSHNAPLQFLHEWPSCRGAAAKRAALAHVALALRHYAAGQRNSVSALLAGDCSPPEYVPEEVEGLLICWEREITGSEYASDHRLRWAVFYALEALVGWPSARSAVARYLTRVIGMCRKGMDDAFVEVQLQAASCLNAALFVSKLPLDLCFSGVASCLSKWMEGPSHDAATPGWLELLRALQRLFEPGQGTHLKGSRGAVAMQLDAQQVDSATVFTSTSSVLRRVVGVVSLCLRHCNPVVRLTAVFVLVALQRAMGETAAAPFLGTLTPAQRRVLHVYCDKQITGADIC